GPNATHAYAESGTYEVALTVVDASGAHATSKHVLRATPPACGKLVSCAAPSLGDLSPVTVQWTSSYDPTPAACTPDAADARADAPTLALPETSAPPAPAPPAPPAVEDPRAAADLQFQRPLNDDGTPSQDFRDAPAPTARATLEGPVSLDAGARAAQRAHADD